MLIGDMPLLVRQFVADRGGVHLLLQEPVISQLYVITGYSIPQFTAIRRILVSNLVSNAGKKLNQHSNSSLSRHPMRGPLGVYG